MPPIQSLIFGEIDKMKATTPLHCATDLKAPLLMLMGKTDFFTSVEDAENYYSKLSNPDKEIIFYDSGHELPPEYINDLLEWVKRQNQH